MTIKGVMLIKANDVPDHYNAKKESYEPVKFVLKERGARTSPRCEAERRDEAAVAARLIPAKGHSLTIISSSSISDGDESPLVAHAEGSRVKIVFRSHLHQEAPYRRKTDQRTSMNKIKVKLAHCAMPI